MGLLAGLVEGLDALTQLRGFISRGYGKLSDTFSSRNFYIPIAFFPYRFLVASAINLLGWSERRMGTRVALGYVAIVALICASELPKGRLYHEAFPTGRARYASLQPLDIMLYIGLPGLCAPRRSHRAGLATRSAAHSSLTARPGVRRAGTRCRSCL